MFREMGLPYKTIEEKGYFLPLSEAHCKFISSARYDDIIVIETSVDSSIKGGMKFNYRIFSEDGADILAEGYTKHAFVNQEGRVVRPPEFLKRMLK